MGLTMDYATYARDAAGRARLTSDFNGDINTLISACTGSRYTDLVKLIKNNWVGEDATNYLRQLETAKTKLVRSLNDLKNVFNQAMANDAKQFASFQSSNKQNVNYRL